MNNHIFSKCFLSPLPGCFLMLFLGCTTPVEEVKVIDDTKARALAKELDGKVFISKTKVQMSYDEGSLAHAHVRFTGSLLFYEWPCTMSEANYLIRNDGTIDVDFGGGFKFSGQYHSSKKELFFDNLWFRLATDKEIKQRFPKQ